MEISTIILYFSAIAWIFPIFRQYRCNLFYFFLILGLSDPITIILLKLFHLVPGYIFVIVAPFLFYAVNINRQKPYTINWLEIFIFVLAIGLLPVIQNQDIITLIIHVLILLRIVTKIIIELHHNQILNIFHLVLAFYMITSVASLIVYLNGDDQAIMLFYINLFFQIPIAIFFSIFSEDNPKLTYEAIPAFKD